MGKVEPFGRSLPVIEPRSGAERWSADYGSVTMPVTVDGIDKVIIVAEAAIRHLLGSSESLSPAVAMEAVRKDMCRAAILGAARKSLLDGETGYFIFVTAAAFVRRRT